MTTHNDRSAKLESLISTEYPKLARYLRTKVPTRDVLDLAQATLVAFVQADAEDCSATSSPSVDLAPSRSPTPQGGTIENDRALLWAIARAQVLRHFEKYRGPDGRPFDPSRHSVADLKLPAN